MAKDELATVAGQPTLIKAVRTLQIAKKPCFTTSQHSSFQRCWLKCELAHLGIRCTIAIE